MRRIQSEDNGLKQKIIDKIISNDREITDNNADDIAWTYSMAIPDNMQWFKTHMIFDPMYNGEEDWLDVYLSYEFFPGESYLIKLEPSVRYWRSSAEDVETAREEFADILVGLINKANKLRNFLEEPQGDFTFVNV